MTGWIETAVGIGAALSPIGIAGTTIAGAVGSAIGGGDAGGGLEPTLGPIAHVEIQGPLNIVEIEGVPLETSEKGVVPQPFNQGTIGLTPLHENKGDAIDEIVKQGPPPGDPAKEVPEDAKSDLRKYLENQIKAEEEEAKSSVWEDITNWAKTIPFLTLPGMVTKGLGVAGEKGIGEVAEVGIPGVAKNDKFSDVGITIPEIPGIPEIIPDYITQNAGIIMIGGAALLLILLMIK